MRTTLISVLTLLLMFSSTSLYAVEESVKKFLRAARDNNIPLAKEAISEGVRPHYILGRGQKIENSLIMSMKPGMAKIPIDTSITTYAKNNPKILMLLLEADSNRSIPESIIADLYRRREFAFLEKIIQAGRISESATTDALYTYFADFPVSEQDEILRKHLTFLRKKGFDIPESMHMGQVQKEEGKKSQNVDQSFQNELDKRRETLAKMKAEGVDLNLLGSGYEPLATVLARDLNKSRKSRAELLILAQLGVDMNMSINQYRLNTTVGSMMLAYALHDPEYLDRMIESDVNFDFVAEHTRGPYTGKAEHAMAFILRMMGTEAFEKVVKAGNSPVISLPVFPDEITQKKLDNQHLLRSQQDKIGRLEGAIKYFSSIIERNELFQDPEYLNAVTRQFKADPIFLRKHGVVFGKDILREAIMTGRYKYALKLVQAGVDIEELCTPPEYKNREDWHHLMSVRERILIEVAKGAHPGYKEVLMHAIQNSSIEFTEALFKAGLNWGTMIPVGQKKFSALRFAMEQGKLDLIESLGVDDEFFRLSDVRDYIFIQLQMGNQDYLPYRQRVVNAVN